MEHMKMFNGYFHYNRYKKVISDIIKEVWGGREVLMERRATGLSQGCFPDLHPQLKCLVTFYLHLFMIIIIIVILFKITPHNRFAPLYSL